MIFQKWAKGVDYGENAFVEWTFNKSLIFNEAEQAESCQKSKGIVSDETILAHHPFVSDVQEELKRVFSDNHEKNHF
ncbi:MAG: phage portal protein [Calditrichaeota bacterium]|nr:phage portal protein [Calditrichota bacterium]